MHIIGMIIWALVSILLAFWMIKKSYAVKLRNFRGRGTTTTATVTRITPGMYLLALFAWVPIFVVTRWLWSALTEHDSDPYHWSFWLLVFIGIILMLLSLLPKVSLIRFVRLIGIALVIWSILEIDGLGHHMPWSNTTQAAEETTAVDCTLVEGSLAKAELELFALKARLSDDKPNGDDVVRREVKNLQNRIKSLRENKGCDLPPAPASAPTVTATQTIEVERDISEEDAKKIAEQIRKIAPDYQPGELDVTTTPNLNQAEERGIASFTNETLESPEEVGAFLSETSGESIKARDRVETAIRDAGFGDDEVERAMDGSCYVALQPKVASQILGTTYYQDGKVLESNEWRSVEENDILWLCFTKDWTLIPDATVRADCGNPELTQLRPIRPTTPPAPPIECATNCTTPTPTPTPTSGGKDASKSPIKGTDDPDERVRGVEPSAPTTVTRPSSSSTSQPTQQQPVLPEDPPEVSDPEPAAPGVTDAPPATGDPIEGCDIDGDGIPDDTCP